MVERGVVRQGAPTREADLVSEEAQRRMAISQPTKSVVKLLRRTVDALVPEADEGRGKRRNAPGSRKQALIRGYPNGATCRE